MSFSENPSKLGFASIHSGAASEVHKFVRGNAIRAFGLERSGITQ